IIRNRLRPASLDSSGPIALEHDAMARRRKEQHDWEGWMLGMGRMTRRLRLLTGMSQEQLARLAGVSQGAVSRLEGGRAVNTPMIVVLKINAAMRRAIARLPPGTLSEEAKSVMAVPARGIPETELRFDNFPVAPDWLLESWIELFWRVPDRQRRAAVELV